MSGLASVLAGHTAPGVYAWESHLDIAVVSDAVMTADWDFAPLDGWVLESKTETLAGLALALDFPDYFGVNLDALADCLRAVGSEGRGTLLLWDGWSPFAYADPDSFALVLRVLRERAANVVLAPMAVLLRGDGPEVDVALLD